MMTEAPGEATGAGANLPQKHNHSLNKKKGAPLRMARLEILGRKIWC